MRTWTSLTVAAVMTLAACGGNGAGGGTDDPVATATEETTDGEFAEVGSADTELGTVLVDGEGRTLYVFDDDTDGESACYEACARTWPPLLGEAQASGAADAALLGTTEREDGSTQVTYAGSPLYLYASDEEPGDVNGQGVGGAWWVVGVDGTAIRDEPGGTGGDDDRGVGY